jgi:hypothetical protein
MANTPAYYSAEFIPEVKRFMIQASDKSMRGNEYQNFGKKCFFGQFKKFNT